MRVAMQLINRFNCPICLWGVVRVFKISEFREEKSYCMRAIYKATCDCVLKGDGDEKGQGKKVAEDVQSVIGRQGAGAEEPLAQV